MLRRWLLKIVQKKHKSMGCVVLKYLLKALALGANLHYVLYRLQDSASVSFGMSRLYLITVVARLKEEESKPIALIV